MRWYIVTLVMSTEVQHERIAKLQTKQTVAVTPPREKPPARTCSVARTAGTQVRAGTSAARWGAKRGRSCTTGLVQGGPSTSGADVPGVSGARGPGAQAPAPMPDSGAQPALDALGRAVSGLNASTSSPTAPLLERILSHYQASASQGVASVQHHDEQWQQVLAQRRALLLLSRGLLPRQDLIRKVGGGNAPRSEGGLVRARVVLLFK